MKNEYQVYVLVNSNWEKFEDRTITETSRRAAIAFVRSTGNLTEGTYKVRKVK